MLINSTTVIDTTQVLLVPYEAKHVVTYHEWMKDEAIQIATASEPLSLEEEYQMQQNWRRDANKLTFIICWPLHDGDKNEGAEEYDEPERLVGDINLFLSISDDDDQTLIGELELMIAERNARRKGMGRAALLAFVRYINEHRQAISQEFHHSHPGAAGDLGFLRVRVGSNNHSSLTLFKSVGFEYLSEEPNVFGEVELRTSADLQNFLDKAFASYPITTYRELEYRRREPSK